MKYRLTYCPPDSEVLVAEVNAGNGAVQNLNALGINIGDIVKIDHDSNCIGPVKVHLKNTAIAIGRELASKVLVESEESFRVTLAEAKVGDEVEVTRINSEGDIRFRLLDMGLVRGVKMKLIRFAPLGDPIEVRLKGFHLSMRLEEAESIEIKVLKYSFNGNGQRRRWWSK